MKLFEYSANNSGGSWWLKDEDWKKLEANGWKVYWGAWDSSFTDRKHETAKEAENDRYFGALANRATKEFESRRLAIREFEDITNQSIDEEGCSCCGSPHYMWEV